LNFSNRTNAPNAEKFGRICRALRAFELQDTQERVLG